MKQTIILFIVLISSAINAQKQIQFISSETNTPIPNIHYIYDNQSGISNSDGIIYFNLSDSATMFLSHITYGKWSLNKKELLNAISKGKFIAKENSYSLYPITIISIKGIDYKNKIFLDYEDKLQHDAAAILEKESSISSIKKGGKYGYDLVFRGFKYDQLNITLDGAQSANAACPNRMDPPSSQMSPNMLNDIELIKGPYALRYGTGIGATINFKSRALEFSDSIKLNGRVSSGYESNGNIKKGEVNLGLKTKKLDFNLFGALSEGNDYLSGNNTLIPSDFHRTSWGMSLGTQLNSNNQLKLSATNNTAKNTDFAALTMDLIRDNTWFINAQHQIQINKKHINSINTTIYTSIVEHIMSNELKELNPRMLNATTDASTLNYGARTESKWNINNGVAYLGADYKIESAEGIRTREFLLGPNKGKTMYDNAWQESEINKIGLFGEINHQKKKTKFTLATRLELNNSKVNTPDDNFSNLYNKINTQQVNPNISFGIDNEISTNSSLKIWLARVQRSGSLVERYINYFPVGLDPYELVGNPDLKAEKNNQIDLIYTWKKENILFSSTIYYSYLQDYIIGLIDTTLTPRIPKSPGVRKFDNISNVFKTGVDFNFKHIINNSFLHELGISYIYAQNIALDQPLAETPPLSLNYTLKSKFYKEKIAPSVTVYYVARQNRISSEYGELATPEYLRLDANLTYKAFTNLKVNGGVNNILNANYYEHLSRYIGSQSIPIYAPGRNIYISLNYIF